MRSLLGREVGDQVRGGTERHALVAYDVVFHIKVQFGLGCDASLSIVDFVAVFRFAGFLQGQIAVGGNDLHLLIGVGLRCGNPDSDFLARGQIFHREGVVKCEVARVLGDGSEG